jgi:hypothetical protein
MDTTEAVPEAAAAPADVGGVVESVIHVRFNPNGTVAEIGQKPSGATEQQWFNFLSQNTLNCYQAFAGGRGIFRLPKAQVESMKLSCVAEGSS